MINALFLADTVVETANSIPSIANSITTSMLMDVLKQMTDLIPIVLPVSILGIGFRKGIAFLLNCVRGI